MVVPARRVLTAANHLGAGHRGCRFSSAVPGRAYRSGPGPPGPAGSAGPRANHRRLIRVRRGVRLLIRGIGHGAVAAAVGVGQRARTRRGQRRAAARRPAAPFGCITGGCPGNGETFGLAFGAPRSGWRTACSPARRHRRPAPAAAAAEAGTRRRCRAGHRGRRPARRQNHDAVVQRRAVTPTGRGAAM